MIVLDMTTLDQLRGLQDEGEDDLLTELIDLFIADVPGRVTAIAAAIADGDWRALAERAHSLKGSAATLGAVHLARLCARLEAMGADASARPQAGAVLAEIEKHYLVVCEALRRERAAVT